MEPPKDSHIKVAKLILRYLVGTLNYDLLYKNSEDCSLSSYKVATMQHLGWWGKHIRICLSLGNESDFMGMKETTHCLNILYRGRVCSSNFWSLWSSMAEKTIEWSFTCSKTPTFCDNNFAIALSKNHMFHKKSKHINTHIHFIQKLVNNGNIFLDFRGLLNEFTDIFAKPLRKVVFEFQRKHLGINNYNI